MFFNGFNEYTRDAFNNDKDRHNVICWILYNTNYCEEEYNGLKTGQCSFSFSTIETECNIKHTRAMNIMKRLEDDGFIEWVFKSKTRHKNSILGLKQETSKKTSEKTSEKTSKPIENTSVEDNEKPVKEPVEKPVKEPSSIKLSKKQSNNNVFYDEIIDYLNEKTGSNFRSNTKATQGYINARIKEGFTIEDFKAVIDVKTQEWLNNPKMVEFLRPKTLFNGDNFEGYLNQSKKVIPIANIIKKPKINYLT